jgi:ferric-dicitrate binding protein FerR (iron transport regulator)
LGTSFNIKEVNDNVEVIVETGLVNVRSSRQNVNLKAHERVVVSHTGIMKNKAVIEDSLYNYYRTNKFICNSTPLYKLISTLNEAYNVDITVENKTALQIPLTTTFEKTQLDNILDVVCTTYGLQMKKSGDKIKLY